MINFFIGLLIGTIGGGIASVMYLIAKEEEYENNDIVNAGTNHDKLLGE